MNIGHGYKPKRQNKYGARKITVDGAKFDSKKEAERWQTLKWMEKAGLIRDLQRQVHFQLTPQVREPDTIGPRGGVKKGKVILEKAEYIADFTYIETDSGKFVVEDTKGWKTPEYILKKKMLYHLRGILIYES